MNLVELPVVDGGVQFGTATVPVSRTELQSTASRTVIVDVRPEDLAIADDGLEFHVSVVEELGSDAYAYGHADLTGSGIDQQQTVVARVDWRQPPRNGGSSQTIAGRATHAARVRPGQRRPLGQHLIPPSVLIPIRR